MSNAAAQELNICTLGRVEYTQAASLQRSLRLARENGAIGDTLLLLEHDPVITCGTRTTLSEVTLARASGEIPLVAVERGGKATYHGPGQLVAYPIFDIKVVDEDVPRLVRGLEGAIIAALEAHDVYTGRREGLPGVWVDANSQDPRKIASVGLRLTKGITFHGIAINVSCSTDPFALFSACGIPDVKMTSLCLENPRDIDKVELQDSVAALFTASLVRSFGYTSVRPVTTDFLYEIANQFPVEQEARLFPWERSKQEVLT